MQDNSSLGTRSKPFGPNDPCESDTHNIGCPARWADLVGSEGESEYHEAVAGLVRDVTSLEGETYSLTESNSGSTVYTNSTRDLVNIKIEGIEYGTAGIREPSLSESLLNDSSRSGSEEEDSKRLLGLDTREISSAVGAASSSATPSDPYGYRPL